MNEPRLTAHRLDELATRIRGLRIAVLGDICLDRYLEIEPTRNETSIETGKTVYNVTNVRSQPGGAGTVINNLAALGVSKIYPIGFCGIDGEGFELQQCLKSIPSVDADFFFQTPLRRTFTYTKPLVIHPEAPPEELNRIDFKNWFPTPPTVTSQIISNLDRVLPEIDALVLLDQVDLPETGVITTAVLDEIRMIALRKSKLLILADSRSRIAEFDSCTLKMNRTELAKSSIEQARNESFEDQIRNLSARKQKSIFVTLSEQGILAASPNGTVVQAPALPIHGPIDVVGAGDSVSAALVSSLGAGASSQEALTFAMGAASVVLHKLGTTGTASIPEILRVLRL
jgi:rfaE bifunctional protein kinase chain/domain